MFSYIALSILLSTKLLYIAIWAAVIFQKFWWHCSLKTWWIKWKCSITTKDTLRHFKLFLKVRMLWLITYWLFESNYFLIKYTTSSSFLHWWRPLFNFSFLSKFVVVVWYKLLVDLWIFCCMIGKEQGRQDPPLLAGEHECKQCRLRG